MHVSPRSCLVEMSHFVQNHISWKFSVLTSGNSVSCLVEFIISTADFCILHMEYCVLPRV